MSGTAVRATGVVRIHSATMFIDGNPYPVTDEPQVVQLPGGQCMMTVLPEPRRSAYRRQRLADIGVREIYPETHS